MADPGRARWGVLGGAFDPVHHGHLRLALECLEQLGLDGMRFIPTGRPVHREPSQAGAADRLRMIELAIAGERRFCADSRELERVGPSYMIDTLESLRRDLANTSWHLILGLDAFALLDTWQRWTTLLDHCHIVVVRRPDAPDITAGSPVDRLLAERRVTAPECLSQASCGAIFELEIPLLDISSTRIRDLHRSGRSIQYLVPEAVAHHIHDKELYGC